MSLETQLARAFLHEHPRDAALALERMPATARAAVVRAVAADAGPALREMVAPAAAECLALLTPAEAAPALDTLAPDVAVALLRRLPADSADRLLTGLPDDRQAPLRRVLAYPEGTAGALMDPLALALPDDISVAEARLRIRREPRGLLSYVFVVLRDGTLAGVLDITELMRARARDGLRSVMHAPVEHVPAWAPAAVVRVHPAWRSFHALPVTDESGRLLGVVRYRTLRRLEREAAADGGAQPAGVTAGALGELFHLGLAGFVEGVAAVAARPRPLTPAASTDDTAGGER